MSYDDRWWEAGSARAWPSRGKEPAVFELFTLFLIGLAGLVALALLLKVIFWVLVLPFRMLGWIFSGVGALLLGVFLVVGGVVLVGAALPVLLIMVVPVLLLGALIVACVKAVFG
jgi:hypothetical protein